MKKLALAAVAAAAMIAGGAQAFTAGTFSNGVVVPNVIHNGANLFTGVGLINQTSVTGSVGVFWTFFDQDSGHVTDSCFPMTYKDYQPFVWNAATSGMGLADKRGYLVFAVGTEIGANACSPASAAVSPLTIGGNQVRLAAHAFTVDTAMGDVAYQPVIDGSLATLTADGAAPAFGPLTNLSALDARSLGFVEGGLYIEDGDVAHTAKTLNMRYFLDAGASTNIVVWSTGSHKGTHTVNMYDDKQNRKSVNFKLDHTELDWFDPATIPGLPADFVDGYIEWSDVRLKVETGDDAAWLAYKPGSVFSYSVIQAPAWGATQSVLGFHYE